MRFDSSTATWVRDMKWHQDQTQTLEPSGHIRLRFPYADQCELVRFSGEHEVLSSLVLHQSVNTAMTAGLKNTRHLRQWASR